MGYDQGNVPVIVNVIQLRSTLSARIGAILFALCCWYLPLSADDNLPADRCGFGDRASKNRVRINQDVQILGTRPPLPEFAQSGDGRFRVHYASKGKDAVDTTDINSNGIPDYVDECLTALDRSWKLEIDTLGYAEPPTDDTAGGSSAIDVYLRDLGREGYYGITNLDRLLALTPSERYTTWMEIDNNFSPTDSTWSGKQSYSTFVVDALRVTCAHELHHVIQNGSYGFSVQHRMIYELSSTWMEMRAYPEVRDWAVWASYLLTRPELWPFSKSNALNGYCWGWFGNVLTNNQRDLMKATWNVVGQGSDPFAALITACSLAGTSLNELFCASLSSLYHTGKRGDRNPYLPEAHLLPEIKFASDINVDGIGETISASVRPFEIRASRANVPSRAGEPVSMGLVTAWSTPASILLRPDSVVTVSIGYTPNPVANDEAIPGSSWGIRYTPVESLCRYSSGIQLLSTLAPYPQPYELSAHSLLYVPVSGASAGAEVRLQLCDLGLRPLTTELVTTVDIHDDRLVAKLPLTDQLTPGVYLITVGQNSVETIIHKIVVKR